MHNNNSNSPLVISRMCILNLLDFYLNRLYICSLSRRLPPMASIMDFLIIIHIYNLNLNFLNRLDSLNRVHQCKRTCQIIHTHNNHQNYFNPCQQVRKTPSPKYPPYPNPRIPNPASPPPYQLSPNNSNDNNKHNIPPPFPPKTHPSTHNPPSQRPHSKNPNNPPTKINSTFSLHRVIQWAKIHSGILVNYVFQRTTS